jgi:hypothetical protein
MTSFSQTQPAKGRIPLAVTALLKRRSDIGFWSLRKKCSRHSLDRR